MDWPEQPKRGRFIASLLLLLAVGGCSTPEGEGTSSPFDPTSWFGGTNSPAPGITVLTITPKPFVEPPSEDNRKALEKLPKAGALPRGVTPLAAGTNRFLIEVPDFSRHYATQVTAEVCWAACSQMALSTQGLEKSQEEILAAFRRLPTLERLFQPSTNEFAGLEDICNALEAMGLEPDGRARVLATGLNKSMHGAVRDLSQGVPVIACLTQNGNVGHAYVLKGIVAGFFEPTLGLLGPLFKNPLTAFRMMPWMYDPADPSKSSANIGVTLNGRKVISVDALVPDMTKYREMYFSTKDPFTNVRIVVHEVILADPYPGAPPEVRLSGEEFKRQLRYLVRVRVR